MTDKKPSTADRIAALEARIDVAEAERIGQAICFRELVASLLSFIESVSGATGYACGQLSGLKQRIAETPGMDSKVAAAAVREVDRICAQVLVNLSVYNASLALSATSLVAVNQNVALLASWNQAIAAQIVLLSNFLTGLLDAVKLAPPANENLTPRQ